MELTVSNRFSSQQIFDLPQLRNRTRVFNNRQEAVQALLELLPSWYIERKPVLLAISSAGYNLATGLAAQLDLDAIFAPVHKVSLPWDGDIDYAAVAFDGTVYLDDEMVERNRLGQLEIDKGIERALATMRRESMTINSASLLPVRNRYVLLLDDGVTTSASVRAAVKALRIFRVKQTSLATTTAYDKALHQLSSVIEFIFCANICSGYSYIADDVYKQPVAENLTKTTIHTSITEMDKTAH